MRTDDSPYREVKGRAAASGLTVSQVIEDAVHRTPRSRSTPSQLADLPVFGGTGVLPGVGLTSNVVVLGTIDPTPL